MKSIREIKDLLSKISKWPWESFKVGPMATVLTGNIPVCDIHYGINKTKDEIYSNGEFIAQSPQLISDLCDRLEEATKALEFYADLDNYKSRNKEHIAEVNMEKGTRARMALDKIK